MGRVARLPALPRPNKLNSSNNLREKQSGFSPPKYLPQKQPKNRMSSPPTPKITNPPINTGDLSPKKVRSHYPQIATIETEGRAGARPHRPVAVHSLKSKTECETCTSCNPHIPNHFKPKSETCDENRGRGDCYISQTTSPSSIPSLERSPLRPSGGSSTNQTAGRPETPIVQERTCWTH